MLFHPLRNVFGLIVLYSIIILGIFVIQFTRETSISQIFNTPFRLEQKSNKNSEYLTNFTLKKSLLAYNNSKGILLQAYTNIPIALFLQN